MSDNKNQDQQPAQQPMGYFMPMQSSDIDDEIDLLKLWNTIWCQKKIIFFSTFIAAVLSIIISLLLPNYYKAEVLLAPESSDDRSKGLSSAFGGLGGLASLAGINLGPGTSVEENIAVLKSREFIWQFIKDNKLMPIIFRDAWDSEKNNWIELEPENQPSLWDAYRAFVEYGILQIEINNETNLVTIKVEWTDPVMAAKWANELVGKLNDYLRNDAIARSRQNLKYLNKELISSQVSELRQILYTLIAEEQKKIMLANTRKEFAFKVIDPAVKPDKKSKPKRVLIVIISTILIGIIAVFWVYLRTLLGGFEEKGLRDK